MKVKYSFSLQYKVQCYLLSMTLRGMSEIGQLFKSSSHQKKINLMF